MSYLLYSGSDIDGHINTYEGLLERCGSTESINTTCVWIAYVLMELWHKRYTVSQKEKKENIQS